MALGAQALEVAHWGMNCGAGGTYWEIVCLCNRCRHVGVEGIAWEDDQVGTGADVA